MSMEKTHKKKIQKTKLMEEQGRKKGESINKTE